MIKESPNRFLVLNWYLLHLHQSICLVMGVDLFQSGYFITRFLLGSIHIEVVDILYLCAMEEMVVLDPTRRSIYIFFTIRKGAPQITALQEDLW